LVKVALISVNPNRNDYILLNCVVR
jgi:hypothetical protein